MKKKKKTTASALATTVLDYESRTSYANYCVSQGNGNDTFLSFAEVITGCNLPNKIHIHHVTRIVIATDMVEDLIKCLKRGLIQTQPKKKRR